MPDPKPHSDYEKKGGYPSPPVPITELPKVPAGPAPGASARPDPPPRLARGEFGRLLDDILARRLRISSPRRPTRSFRRLLDEDLEFADGDLCGGGQLERDLPGLPGPGPRHFPVGGAGDGVVSWGLVDVPAVR